MRDSQRDLSIRESGVQGFEMRCFRAGSEQARLHFNARLGQHGRVQDLPYRYFPPVGRLLLWPHANTVLKVVRDATEAGGRLGSRRQFGLRIQGFGLHD